MSPMLEHDFGSRAQRLSAQERDVLRKIAAGHLWPLGAQPGCADALYRKGLTTSTGEWAPIRLSSAGAAVAALLEAGP